MVAPHFLLSESSRSDTHGTKPSTFSELSKNALYWQMIVEGLAQRQIDKVSDERNQDRI
jgi:hypothetical protein